MEPDLIFSLETGSPPLYTYSFCHDLTVDWVAGWVRYIN